jgi:hypothetical protein
MSSFPSTRRGFLETLEKHKLVIQSIALVHNVRTEIIGLNPINTVFDPESGRHISLRGYDRIRSYIVICLFMFSHGS